MRTKVKPSEVSIYSVNEEMFYRGWPTDHAPAPTPNTGPYEAPNGGGPTPADVRAAYAESYAQNHLASPKADGLVPLDSCGWNRERLIDFACWCVPLIALAWLMRTAWRMM